MAAAPAPAALPPLPTCPGVEAGKCALACQRAVCGGLAAFFRRSYNASSPWNDPGPWMETLSRPCSSLIPDTSRGRAGAGAGAIEPPYCRWPGVACCGAAAAAAGACWPLHGVEKLSIRADKVNGSTSDPELMAGVEQLHACGLRSFVVESNDMSGELGPRWGRLVNLTELNLGGCAASSCVL